MLLWTSDCEGDESCPLQGAGLGTIVEWLGSVCVNPRELLEKSSLEDVL